VARSSTETLIVSDWRGRLFVRAALLVRVTSFG
jgi:hypothetical protein